MGESSIGGDTLSGDTELPSVTLAVGNQCSMEQGALGMRPEWKCSHYWRGQNGPW